MNTKIKLIDVFGQFEDQGTDHYYTYLPTGEAPAGWRTVMKDPRNEVNANLQQCYLTWCTATDWWIAKMIKNPHDSRGGFAMLSICLGANRPLDGGGAVKVLDSFAQFFIVEKHWIDADAEKALMNQEENLLLVPCALRRFVEPTASINSAYRSFEVAEELYSCMSFLPQPGYEKYSRIFFVQKGDTQGMPVPCLDASMPLRSIYTLQYPEDCSSSPIKSEIMEGEELILTYTKKGREPFEVIIKGGISSEYAYVEGMVMRIRSGKELGLVHNRVVEIICKDKTGRRIEGFTLRNYTQQNNTVSFSGNKVILPENTTQETIVRVEPRDDQFEPAKVNLTEVKDDRVEVSLEPKKYKVVFKMSDRVFETTETMNPSEVRTMWGEYDYKIDEFNSIVYFRAHRITNDSKHQFVNGDKDLPIGKRIGNFFKDWWLHLLIVLLTLLLLGYGIYAAISLFRNGEKPWPFGTKNEAVYENNEGGQAPVLTEGEVKEAGEQEVKTIDSTAFYVQQDIDYLVREKKLWTKDNIRTKEYQELFDNISNGRIEEVITQYDALLGGIDKTNNTIKMIVDGLVRLRQTGNQSLLKEASDEMKRLSKSGSIKLDELLTSINMIVNKSQSNKPMEPVTKSSSTSSTHSSGQNTSTPTERPKSD